MATQPLQAFLCRLRNLAASNARSGACDAQLLQRFAVQRDAAAFEVLVWRHGGVVLNVCRRLLRHAEDTEDVFQATFLTLARRAGSISKAESLASWIYKVAYRVALRVRAHNNREVEQQRRCLPLAARRPASNEGASDMRLVLDEEINHLPEKYRSTVVLCYLQGKTTEEAGQQLGCPRGTICSRLAWARRRLRNRLTRRGLAFSAGGLAAALTPVPTQAALVASTVGAAVVFVSGQTSRNALIGPAVALAEGVLRSMVITKLRTAALVLVVLGGVGLGAGVWEKTAFADKPGTADVPALVRATGDGIRLPEDLALKAGIQVVQIHQRAAARPRVLVFPGSLSIDPERLSRVRCRCAPAEVVQIGKLQGENERRDLRTGDNVRKGQLLAILHSSDAAAKKHELFEALRELRLEEHILERAEAARQTVPEVFILSQRRTVVARRGAITRAEQTLMILGIPAPEIDAVRKEAQQAGVRERKAETEEERKTRLDRWALVELRAPNDGTIVERNITLHEVIADPTINLFQIAQLNRLKVIAQVPEDDLPLLNALKAAQRRWTVRTRSGAAEVEGSIDEIGYLIDPNQHTAVATGFIDNPEGHLRAGQFITASVALPPPTGELVLPARALVEDGRHSFVFVQPNVKQFLYEQRRVAVVRRSQDLVHVRSRLIAEQERQGFQTVRPGERVVTAGAIELKAYLEDLKAQEDR
jgi:cobalt-zinc-cadmium efflux system membrane fusion protein